MSLFLPIFPPIIILDFLFFNLESHHQHHLLLNPILLIIPESSVNLNNLGLGFPSCAFGVKVPISINPNPKQESSSINFKASLSNPAAKPTGLENFIPKTFFLIYCLLYRIYFPKPMN